MAYYKKFSSDKGNKSGGFSSNRGGQGRFGGTDRRYGERSDSQQDDSRSAKGRFDSYSANNRKEQDRQGRIQGGNRFGRNYQGKGEGKPFSKPGTQRNPHPLRPGDNSSFKNRPADLRGLYGRPAPSSNAPLNPRSDFSEHTASVPILNELPENLLSGRNPIREAIKAGRDIEKLMVAEGDLSGSGREIVSMAKNAGIIVQVVERSRLDQITRNHQGMIAFASAFAYSSLDDILNTARVKNEPPFIVILDKITDPMNLGAIIRSAACVGAHGVIVQQHRAVGLTPSAVRASAGAVEHVKVARVTNINQTIRALKDLGVWVYAADSKGEDYRQVDFSGACALVIGSEGDGVSQLTLNLCDKTVSIPMSGVMDSFNASVAAGILMYGVYSGRTQ